MLSQTQISHLLDCDAGARASQHLWPDYAACEGAVESGWFASKLYLEDNNIFGCKQHTHPVFGTVSIPTREFLNGVWMTVDAEWVKYPTLADAFNDRMNTLRTLAPEYPHYAAALAATTGEEFITQVSLTWSTGPQRGEEVLQIYNAHHGLFPEVSSDAGT